MPTFLFFRNKIKVDSMRGADPAALEEKVKKWYGEGDEGDTDVGVKGHVSMILVEFVVYSFNCVACVQPKLIR